MKERLDLPELAGRFGIDLLSVTGTEPLRDTVEQISKRIAEGYLQRSPTRFPSLEDIVAFCDPRRVMAQARSVLVGALGYYTEEPQDRSQPGQPHGLIARYMWRNHYRALRKRMIKLARYLKQRMGGAYRVYANGPVAEKPLAQRAGLGYYGKHAIIVTKKFGSMVVLGTIFTDVELVPGKPIGDGCGACRLCIDRCPTGAIVAPYILDWSRCIQYLSNWHGILPAAFRRLWGNRLYGCSTCQDVCPKNQKVKAKPDHPVEGDVGPSFPLLRLLKMDEAEYRTVFGANQMAARWIKFDCIRRNAVIALGNAQDPGGIQPLIKCLGEEEPMLRVHAAWALGRLGGGRAKTALARRRRAEDEPRVLAEIESALERFTT